jgi:hypothetical protein
MALGLSVSGMLKEGCEGLLSLTCCIGIMFSDTEPASLGLVVAAATFEVEVDVPEAVESSEGREDRAAPNAVSAASCSSGVNDNIHVSFFFFFSCCVHWLLLSPPCLCWRSPPA